MPPKKTAEPKWKCSKCVATTTAVTRAGVLKAIKEHRTSNPAFASHTRFEVINKSSEAPVVPTCHMEKGPCG